ncbi:MAG: protein kinase [Phycisphaerae bacterium]
MPLDAGTRLGAYEIVAPIGAGGMGEVYLARDTNLDRQVAVKVLPETMVRDAERVARFEREAKLLASLNHPDIAAVYGFDEAGGKRFLVMEYIEGVTLAQQLENGALPIEEALETAKHIAEALEAAHEKGIIHRDLKPGNVMVRPDGAVKVLDFGLARAMLPDSATSGAVHDSPTLAAHSPTITADFTRPGVVLGTAAYMSPEQARGRSLDKRTDIWSLGVILFECLAGGRLFGGETATDSMGAIMHKEPDWSLLPPGTPPTIQLLLQRCLTKDRKRRLHDAADARIELENALVDPASTSLGLARMVLDERPRSRLAQALPWLLAVAAFSGLALLLLNRSAPELAVVARLTIEIPEALQLSTFFGPELSPDGDQVILHAESDGQRKLFLRRMDQPELAMLVDANWPYEPRYSPDGEWIAYHDRDHVRKLSLRGGPATTLCEAPNGRGLAWLNDDTIVVAPDRTGGLFRLSAAGGSLEPFTQAPPGDAASYRHPVALPNGRGILFTSAPDAGDWESSVVLTVGPEGGEPRELIRQAAHARYAPTGHLLFNREGTLMAAPFDLDRLELTGNAVPVVGGFKAASPGWPSPYTVSENGTLVYIPDTGPLETRIVTLSMSGEPTPLSSVTADFEIARLSPDGERIAAIVNKPSGKEDLLIIDLRRDLARPLAVDDQFDAPIWSPDGEWIIFSSGKDGVPRLHRARSDFIGVAEPLLEGSEPQFAFAWSPDGRTIVFQQPDAEYDLWSLRLDESGAPAAGGPERLMDRPGARCCAQYSADGRWLLFRYGETGVRHLFVRAVDGAETTVQVSKGTRVSQGTFSPIESRIFYAAWERRSVRAVHAVDFAVEEERFVPSAQPEKLFEFDERFAMPGGAQVTPDGKHFVALERLEDARNRVMPVIVVNWFEELEAKLRPRTD